MRRDRHALRAHLEQLPAGGAHEAGTTVCTKSRPVHDVGTYSQNSLHRSSCSLVCRWRRM